MDYDTWLRTAPYSWFQEEKEIQYIDVLTKLTQFHQDHCKAYRKTLSLFTRLIILFKFSRRSDASYFII